MGFIWRLQCRCGSTQLRRSSRRNAVEHALGAFVKPWRCEVCDRRMFRLAWLRSPVKPPPPNKPGPPGGSTVVERAIDYTARAFDRGTGDSDI